MKKINKFINFKSLFLTLLIFLLFYYSSLFQLIPIYILDLNINKITNAEKVILSTFSNIILLIILFLIFKKELINEWKVFNKNRLKNLDTGLKYWLLGLGIMMISNTIINFILQLGQAANEQAVQQMISSLPWLMFINAGFIAPIIEEIIFRKSFKKAFINNWLYVFTSAIVFGSLHVITIMSSPLELLYIIPYGALGAAFAISYVKTKNIYTSIAFHIFHNSLLILLSIAI